MVAVRGLTKQNKLLFNLALVVIIKKWDATCPKGMLTIILYQSASNKVVKRKEWEPVPLFPNRKEEKLKRILFSYCF